MSGVGRVVVVSGMFLVLFCLSLFAADTPASGPNSDPTYQQLRNLTLGSEAVAVNNFALKREAATFHLRSGTVCFLAAVQGKVTGAVFSGDGNFVINPPSTSERSMLKLLTKEDEFSENFSQAVFRFTDSSYDELKKAGSTVTGGCDAGLLKDSQNTTRHNRELKFNLEARILEDVLSPAPGGLFVAFVHGKRYNSKEIFAIDPHSSEDQVELETYDEAKLGMWMGYSLSPREKSVSRNRIHIDHQQLDTTIEKSANLTGKASTMFVSQIDGLRVVRMMMWDRKNGDQKFRETMQDFVKTYSNRAATTEDFKAMVEKHMTPEMDLEGNHRMDWFFNEYIFGTALPSYKLDYSFDKDPSGDVLFSFKVTQSGVDDKFRMIVPIYLDLADGRVVNLGRARMVGNTSVEQKLPIRGLKTAPKRALVNYNYDVLASN